MVVAAWRGPDEHSPEGHSRFACLWPFTAVFSLPPLGEIETTRTRRGALGWSGRPSRKIVLFVTATGTIRNMRRSFLTRPHQFSRQRRAWLCGEREPVRHFAVAPGRSPCHRALPAALLRQRSSTRCCAAFGALLHRGSPAPPAASLPAGRLFNVNLEIAIPWTN